MGALDILVGPVATLATDLLDRIFPDKVAQASEREKFILQAQALDNQLAAAQAQIDANEAQSSSIFVSGARPFIMWVCGLAFAYHLILQPLASFIMAAFGHSFPLPDFDTTTLNTTLMGMLGLGGLRTYEKMQGVVNKH